MNNIQFPWPINIKAQGNINNTDIIVNGAGVIRTLGVYESILNFNKIPPKFHPSAIATFIVSNCCGAGASTRNGGKNMTSMGVIEYEVERRLELAGGLINMHGKAYYTNEALVLDIDIEGNIDLPDDLIGHSVYLKKVYPSECKSKAFGVGEGSLFRANGEDVPLTINTKYNLTPSVLPNPLEAPEYRIATEDGVLNGNSYSLRIHSIFDGINTMEGVTQKSCCFE
ncbi:hypothetical protein ACHSBP_18480 [Pseudoalteromonas sp. XMcav1-K]|uniref:hypothetical protein n=1 Tax=Pseudoalteromonas sp. XMcav1-K TaxID=3374372 RepID=UPI0037573192